MRLLWWSERDRAFGVGVAVAALAAVAAATAPGPEVGRAAAQVRPGMPKEEVERLLRGSGEEDREFFQFSSMCGPRPWYCWHTRQAYRGPLTTVEVEYLAHTGHPLAVSAVRVRPTFALLPGRWFVGAALLGLAATELSRRFRRRGESAPVPE